MPRLPTAVLLKAFRENPLLTLLLKECRTLDSARNELRWLRERAIRDSQQTSGLVSGSPLGWRTRLRSMCYHRAQGYPLQYLLGDTPFGDLEILCRPGVLIPRPDTESYTYQAAKMVRQLGQDSRPSLQSATRSRPFRILDLCTGTGCIALLLHALLSPHLERCQILGIDISPKALSLARRNLDHNIRSDCLDRRASFDVQFHQADVLLETANGSIPTVEEIVSNSFPYQSIPDKPPTESGCDLLISNPPYISTSDFRDGTTARSVRLFEPRLALIPPASNHPGHKSDRHEDIFYRRILALSLKLAAKITLLECGDLQQAQRVVRMHNQMRGSTSGLTAEIWPSQEEDLAANGFHAHEGSRCVIIHNLARKAE